MTAQVIEMYVVRKKITRSETGNEITQVTCVGKWSTTDPTLVKRKAGYEHELLNFLKRSQEQNGHLDLGMERFDYVTFNGVIYAILSMAKYPKDAIVGVLNSVMLKFDVNFRQRFDIAQEQELSDELKPIIEKAINDQLQAVGEMNWANQAMTSPPPKDANQTKCGEGQFILGTLIGAAIMTGIYFSWRMVRA